MFAGWKDSLPLRVIITGAGLAIIVAGLKFASSILAPIIFSLFMAILCLPILSWLQRKHVPTWLALLFILLGLFICIALLGLFIYVSLNGLDERLPVYEERLQALISQVRPVLQQLGIDTSGVVPTNSVNIGQLFGTISSFLRATITSLTSLFLIMLGITFALLEAGSFAEKLRRSGSRAQAALAVGVRFSSASQQFFYLKAINNLIVAVGATLFLLFYRIDFALLWGVLIFFLSYIPNIGIVLACVPPVILALLQYGLVGALIVVGVLFVINLIGDNAITPRLMGTGLDISPSIIFFSFIFWTWVFGVVGALLSVPLTVLVKFICEANDETRWLATLMSSSKPGKAPEPTTVEEPEERHPTGVDTDS